MRSSSLSLTAEIAHKVGRTTVSHNLAVVNTLEILSVHGVAKGSYSSNLRAIDGVECVVDNHGTLRIAAEDDLGVGALLEGEVDQSSHLGAARGSHVGVTGCVGWVVYALDSAGAGILYEA